jgi:hypothetical protein
LVAVPEDHAHPALSNEFENFQLRKYGGTASSEEAD